MNKVIVVGAGIGGLTTAAVLARAGVDVTVLEAHIYPGGCAGTFYHQGYRFDAGATLAGGFAPGGVMDMVARKTGIQNWPAQLSQSAMIVHMPDGSQIWRWGDQRRIEAFQHAFGDYGRRFWNWQESTADAMWELAVRTPYWPPQTPGQIVQLGQESIQWLKSIPEFRVIPGLLEDAFRPVAWRLRNAPEKLRLFVDGQLLIAAQATSATTNALYGAAALDLPRRGVAQLNGGMGAIADALVQAVRNWGGQVYFRQEVRRVILEGNLPVAVETKRGESFAADLIVFNLPPWNIAALMGDHAPRKLRYLPPKPTAGWGAFMVYLGVEGTIIPDNFALHHQVLLREPLGDGNSIFISVSPAWDESRAPKGYRAFTISTHTNFGLWWDQCENDRSGYEKRKSAYTKQVIEAAERVFPGLREAITLVLPGTPVTFERFTRRAWGWVGGFPQTDLFRGWGPRLGKRLWLVGDSIFPGQSTAAVALGGLRVANDIYGTLTGETLQEYDLEYAPSGE